MSYNEFRRTFQASEEDMESRGETSNGGGTHTFEFIPPKPITEIAEQFSVSPLKFQIKPFFFRIVWVEFLESAL